MLDLAALRAALEADGLGVLVVDELRTEDLERLRWSGTRAHLRSMATQLERVAAGEAEYLVVRAPGGEPIAKAGIDFGVDPGRGVIWQVATHEELQGLGIGTFLFERAEDRIRARGRRLAALSVEVDNPRALALYERLGLVGVGRRSTGGEVDGADGTTGWYSTEVLDMEKPLPPRPG